MPGVAIARATSPSPPRPLPQPWAESAALRLPRYTSYPTARSFASIKDEDAPTVMGDIGRHRPGQALSAYVHVPFCERLCWYCGCNTSVFHRYTRVAAFHQTLLAEIDLWAAALGDHAGLSHLHFGGGSPNALSADDFVILVSRLSERIGLAPKAEIAVELDPGLMDASFAQAVGAAGVTRASLGVQTLDPGVQARINRFQDFARVAQAVADLRAAGVGRINFDLMHGLPGQDPDIAAATAVEAIQLAPDRLSVFGYAHVPWMKKHQSMIREDDLADVRGRWDQAEAIDAVLVEAGYVRIGLDHYARPDDPMADAAGRGQLHRNFQGYTDDEAAVLVPIGPSSIGCFEDGFVQNATAMDDWRMAVAKGRLPLGKQLTLTEEDRLRAAVIERLMCDLDVDVGAVCAAHGVGAEALDYELAQAAQLGSIGLCSVDGRIVSIPEPARRMMRVVAACFDADAAQLRPGHAAAI